MISSEIRHYLDMADESHEATKGYFMPDSKTYIVNDQPTDKDALDFKPYVETLADIVQTGNTSR